MDDFSRLKRYLYSYIGTGWTVTGEPIGMMYLSKLQSAEDIYELLDLADELNIKCFDCAGNPLF